MRDISSDAVTLSTTAITPGDWLERRYEVIEHIGSGGMADVYRGWDEQLCRDVAIKVLKPARISDVMRKRVLREARASCAVDHPHMVRVTAIGEVNGAPYLVMDLLQGVSLAEKLKRSPGGRLDWREAIGLLLPAMDALHLAHAAGIVHRDLKPENLFVHRRGDADVLMVLDLGIVKFMPVDGAADPRWTQTGMILGTAAYMSPEQANSGAIDHRSDVYSLGVTLYRLLSGQHLFPAATEDGPIAAMTRHLFEPPPRLTVPGLPPALVEAVATALIKEPERRHGSMLAFAVALRACLELDAPNNHTTRLAAVSRGALHVALGAALALAVPRAVASADPTPDPPVQPPPVSAPTVMREAADAPPPLPQAVPLVRHQVARLVGLATRLAAPGVRPPRPREQAPATPPTPPTASPFLAARGAMQRCLRQHGDPDAATLSVHVTTDADGSVTTAGIRGDDDASFLAACVRQHLTALRFAPGSGTHEYTYRFTGVTP